MLCKDTLDELLIGAVKTRKALYDYRIPASERSTLRKNALWIEISNILGGALTSEEAKVRWKYLRDNYIKARKKIKSYILSGSAVDAANVKKSKFRFYDIMTFLNDICETRQTVSSLTDNVIENEIYEKSKQHKDDVTSFSESDISPPTQTTTHASSSSTLTLVSPQTSTLNNIPATNSKRPLQNIDNLDITPRRLIPIKKQKSDDLQTALIEALKEPIGQTTDPLDDFLARLGEGMRRLPYRVRARLEIEFLTLLAEKEACCTNNDLNDI